MSTMYGFGCLDGAKVGGRGDPPPDAAAGGLSHREAEARLGVDRSVVDRWVKEGLLTATPVRTVGRAWEYRIPEAEVESLRAARTLPAGYVTLEEAEARLGVSRAAVRGHILSGRLGSWSLPGSVVLVYVRKADLDELDRGRPERVGGVDVRPGSRAVADQRRAELAAAGAVVRGL